uniref:Elongator complex protein 5 n=1 Tax=Timema poppense TaxID=170557 RepID=A0A7R9CZK5_TIMPO|nr:unnamed protein product [Timema poppensis]
MAMQFPPAGGNQLASIMMVEESEINTEGSYLFLEVDSTEQSGQVLLSAFIQRIVDTENNVHILCYENPIAIVKSRIYGTNIHKIQFHDAFYDHKGWFKAGDKEAKETETRNDLLTILQNVKSSSTSGNVVIIDSLSPLILNMGFCESYRQLHMLLNSAQSFFGLTVSRLVSLVHEDVLPNASCSLPQLHHMATTLLKVSPPVRANPIVHITHVKPGGKVLSQREWYTVSGDNSVTSGELTSADLMAVSRPSESLPEDLTTFKLGLGEEEKQARSRLVLPYLRVDSGGDVGSKVFYEPDAADDWDEEDPDDDLDV